MKSPRGLASGFRILQGERRLRFSPGHWHYCLVPLSYRLNTRSIQERFLPRSNSDCKGLFSRFAMPRSQDAARSNRRGQCAL